MGWNARMKSGGIYRQRDGRRFTEIDLHEIEEMWLDGLEGVSIDRRFCPGFREFVCFETGAAGPAGQTKLAEFIGWTDGAVEYLVGRSAERHAFHPHSAFRTRR